MAALTLTIEPDEFLGLSALVELGRTADAGHANATAGAATTETTETTEADILGQARALMRSALADKLATADLPWAPSADAVKEHAADAAEPAGRLHKLADNETVRRDATYILVVAGLVALVGGYAGPWKWTGFEENGQVWDWLSLLLLPVVLGTIPLWIQDREYIGQGRRIIFGAFIVAFTGFVIAGYLVPISWSGFSSQKLWNWIELLVLPAALAITAALTSRGIQGRWLRPYEKGTVIALLAGWIITVIGGYALRWKWTGYPGNTLWEWLQMLLVPLVFPTILLPFLLKWISGNAAERAATAHEPPTATTAGRARP
jgi:hypothetical protein